MWNVAEAAIDIGGKGICLVLAFIAACGAALYFGGKND